MSQPELGRASAIQLIVQFGIRGIGIISTMLLAQLLNPEYLGYIAGILSACLLLSPLVDAGVDTPISQLRISCKREALKLLFKVFLLKFAMLTLVASPILIIYNHLASPQSLWNEFHLILALLIIICRCVSGTICAHLRAQHFFKTEAWAQLIGRVVDVLILLNFLSLAATPSSALAAMLTGSMATCVILFILLCSWPKIYQHNRQQGYNIQRISFCTLFYAGIPFLGTGVIIAAYSNGAQVAVASIAGNHDAAMFKIASLIPMSAAALIGSIALPLVSLVNKESSICIIIEIYKETLLFGYKIFAPIAIGLATNSRNLIELVFGKSYIDAAICLQWLCIYILIIPISNTTGQLLGALGAQRIVFISSVFNLLIFMGLLYALTPVYGAKGAAFALVVTEFWGAIIMCSYLAIKKHVALELGWLRPILVPIASTLILGLISRNIDNIIITAAFFLLIVGFCSLQITSRIVNQ